MCPIKSGNIVEGRVIQIEGKKDTNLEVKKYEFIDEYNSIDYLPTVKRNIEDIMDELELYTEEYITSKEGKALNDYFFKNEEFLEKFKRGIGGVSMHHNYIGGLAEHTLGVMYLTIMLCERYNCRNHEYRDDFHSDFDYEKMQKGEKYMNYIMMDHLNILLEGKWKAI